MDLLKIELAVADWAYETAAHGDRTVAELLTPESGWTLPAETRRRFQALPRFDLRTVVYSDDSGHRDDYYGTDRGRNPSLPGEVADYLGVEAGGSFELQFGPEGEHLVLTRDAHGGVRLNGLGDHIAERGKFGGEVWLTFSRNGEFSWQPVGFWHPMEGEPWVTYKSAEVCIYLPSGVVEAGPATGGISVTGLGEHGFTDRHGAFPFADDDRIHIITASEPGSVDSKDNDHRNAELRKDIELYARIIQKAGIKAEL
jgi:hypothetical protein